jgi:hypothetical protein
VRVVIAVGDVMAADQPVVQAHLHNRLICSLREPKHVGATVGILTGFNIPMILLYSVQNLLSSSLLSKKLKIKIYRIVILPVVLYGCETWSLTLRDERRLRVFENRVVRGVFGPKRDEVTGEWRKLHNEELSDLYSLPNIVRVVKSRRMRWAGHIARVGERRGVYRVLVGKPGERDHWGDPDLDGRIILRWIFRKWEGVVGTGWSWLRVPKFGEFLD